jgi:Cupredoxin-like domain
MRAAVLALAILTLGAAGPRGIANAQEFTLTLTLTLKGNKFEPAEIRVPAKKRFTVYVINDDPTPEEFDSQSMKVEKVIAGNSKGLVRIGPLDPGRYDFIGEFHADTAKGVMIAE